MNSTGDFKIKNKDQVVLGYEDNKTNEEDLPVRSRPSGSYYSTAFDLYKFLKGVFDDPVIEIKILEEFYSKKVSDLEDNLFSTGYGYGFQIDEKKGIERIGHAGDYPGVSTIANYYPAQDLYIIILSNRKRAARTHNEAIFLEIFSNR
jgi:hypothetical protein